MGSCAAVDGDDGGSLERIGLWSGVGYGSQSSPERGNPGMVHHGLLAGMLPKMPHREGEEGARVCAVEGGLGQGQWVGEGSSKLQHDGGEAHRELGVDLAAWPRGRIRCCRA